MRADTKMGDTVKIHDELLTKAQAKEEAKVQKTRAEYIIEESEEEPSVGDKELIDDVDEEDISEISLQPENEVDKDDK